MTTGLEHPHDGHDPEEPDEIRDDIDPEAPALDDPDELPLEANPADVIDQRLVVPSDEADDRAR